MNNFGKNLNISIFGESHCLAIGVILSGLKPGIKLDLDFIQDELNRRKPGGELSSKRREDDKFLIKSGVVDGITTGAPIMFEILNLDTKASDYEPLKNIMRPSHSDYSAYIKYNGFNDVRGGGHFSARITAPLVIVGAICKQMLLQEDIIIAGNITQVGQVVTKRFSNDDLNSEVLFALTKKALPNLSNKEDEIIKEINHYQSAGDSIGGTIEIAAINLPVGIGAPFFNSLESHLSQLVFSIPGVKGIEFGLGFEYASSCGSDVNDQMQYRDNNVELLTNNNGGITGGITNGAPLVMQVVLKPTASILKVQKTINVKTKENVEFQIEGRHDPCIVPRAIVILESVVAICVYDLLIELRKGV